MSAKLHRQWADSKVNRVCWLQTSERECYFATGSWDDRVSLPRGHAARNRLTVWSGDYSELTGDIRFERSISDNALNETLSEIDISFRSLYTCSLDGDVQALEVIPHLTQCFAFVVLTSRHRMHMET